MTRHAVDPIMKRSPPAPDGDPVADAVPALRNFSLVLGGPLYQLLRKAHLDDDAVSHLKRRILVICGIVWLPLFVLSASTGLLTGGVRIPFLHDIESHARFLVAIPLMLVAELVVHQRTRGIVAQFVERKLVTEESMARFKKAIAGAIAWRNSIAAEVALILIVLPLGYYLRTDVFALKTSTWYATAGPTGPVPTLPGLWFFWVSNPALQFLFLRWLFRLAIWGRFLWQVSRIELDLIPTHPDRNAGLGFLGGSAYAFSPLLASFSAMVAGLVASRIVFEGAKLPDFKLEIVSLVAIGMALVFGPLTVFAPRVMAAKRSAKRSYGRFAAEYMRGFDRRWIQGSGGDIEAALGSADIQSLADLDNAYTIIKETKPVPFSRDTVLQLVWATLLPFVPLVFTMIPFEELLDRLVKAVF
jgi:hypothetical protein